MSDLTLSNVEAKLAGLRRLTWRPVVQEGESSIDASKTSGKAWFAPGELWPTCPNCQKSMRLVLQLNLQALPTSLNQQFGEGLLQLFCCESDFEIHTDDHISGLSSSVRSKFQLTRIVQPQRSLADISVPAMEENFPAKQIVGWQESQEYPHIEELETLGIALNDQEVGLLAQSELHAQVGDKLGGWICWAQTVDYPSCPSCNQAMNQLIFQLESDYSPNFPYPHNGLGVGYLVQCPEHREQVTFFCQFT